MDSTRDLLRRRAVTLPGFILLGLALIHVHLDEGTITAVIAEVILPILVAALLIGVGYRYGEDDLDQRGRKILILGTLAGGGLFAAITGWILIVVSLEGGIPDEIFQIVLNGTAPGMLLSILLIAIYLRLERQSSRLETMNDQLMSKNDRLDEFASIVSHDLRSPLNVARGKLELALETDDGDHLEAVNRSLDRMETIIQDILTLSRQGEEIGELETVELEAVVKAAWESVQTDQIELKIEEVSRFEADRRRVRQVLENLFRNALDHGGDSLSEVRVGSTASNGFYVEDDGVGIPPENQKDVFDPGYSTGPEGSGLGLNIVGAVVDAHGWDIDIAESDDGGARFEFQTGPPN